MIILKSDQRYFPCIEHKLTSLSIQLIPPPNAVIYLTFIDLSLIIGNVPIYF